MRLAAVLLLFMALTLPGGAQVPRLDAVAETRLLMEGLANPNFRGIEKNLKDPPESNEAWTFARGQALLIAETANLLMLRPPRSTPARTIWYQRAIDLRRQAAVLGQVLAKRDYAGSRAAFVELANSCNRCHQAFRVQTEIVPFGPAPPPRTAGRGV